MTQFDELNAAYWDSFLHAIDARDSCLAAAATMIDEIRRRLVIPDDNFAYFPFDENYAGTGGCHPMQAGGFIEDGWFEVKFLITFQRDERTWPTQPVIFALFLQSQSEEKSPGELWRVKLFPDDAPLNVDLAAQDNLTKLCDRFFQHAQKFMSMKITGSIDGREQKRPIGYAR